MADKDSAIRAIVILLIYFIILFTIFSFVTNLNSDLKFSSAGFKGVDQLRQQGGACGYPRETATEWFWKTNSCRHTYAETEADCLSIAGCNVTTSFLNNQFCEGDINVSYYHNGTDIGDNICDASGLDNDENTCRLIGCTWTEFSGLTDQELSQYAKPSTSNILKTVGFLGGMNADLGLSGIWYTLFSFIFFYLPFVILIGAIYSLIPFI